MKPSLRHDEGAVGNPTHKSFSYQSFPVNYFNLRTQTLQSKFTTVGRSKYIVWFR